MQRVNKLASLELILRSMMHEINNALSVIKLETECLPDEGLQKRIDSITAIVRLIQGYSRQEPPHYVPCQVNDAVTKSLELCHTLLKGYTMECKLAHKLPPVQADPNQLQQIMIDMLLHIVQFKKKDRSAKLHITTKQIENDIVVEMLDKGGVGYVVKMPTL